MFLSSEHSFVVTRKSSPKSVSKNSFSLNVFSPNSQSFYLTRLIPLNPVFQSAFSNPFSPNSQSFSLTGFAPLSLTNQSDAQENATNLLSSSPLPPEEAKVNDKNKRDFLKAAGIAGATLAGTLIFPQKAKALIMGSSPTTGVVGVKDSANTRIDPATEGTLGEVLKTSDLSFDSGLLEVKVTSTSGAGSSSFSDSLDVAKSALVDADRHVQVDVLSSALPSTASTETTLETISFGGFKFTLHLDTVGDIDYIGEATIGTATSAAAWRIKRIDSSSGMILKWAGTGVFDQVWDDRLTLTYN